MFLAFVTKQKNSSECSTPICKLSV